MNELLHEICHELLKRDSRFSMMTVQLEQGNGTQTCKQEPDEVI